MALTRARNRKVRTAAIAVVISSLALMPRTAAGFNDLLTAKGVPPSRAQTLRRAWRDGAIVVFAADVGLFATRSGVLSYEQMEAEFQRALTASAAYLRSLARGVLAGEMGLSEFYALARAEIEDDHWDALLLLVGPLLTGAGALLALLTAFLARQLQFLDALLADILSGKQALDGTLLRRIAMYAGGGWAALQALLAGRALGDGMREERNVLGRAEHCDGCLTETARDWVPIGTLIPVGERTCLSNCRCHLEYR